MSIKTRFTSITTGGGYIAADTRHTRSIHTHTRIVIHHIGTLGPETGRFLIAPFDNYINPSHIHTRYE